jgi:hypothetical protein
VDENAINGLMEVAMVGQMDTPDALCAQTESVMGSVFVFLRPVGSAEKRVPLYPTVGYHRERSDCPLECTGEHWRRTPGYSAGFLVGEEDNFSGERREGRRGK